MTSLLTFVQRGSAIQTLCGCCLAAGSLVLQVQLAPYHSWRSNLLKALVDGQIFLTFLVSFILRLLSEGAEADIRQNFYMYEPFSGPTAAVQAYGWLLIGSMVAVAAVGIGLIAHQVLDQNREQANMDYILAAIPEFADPSSPARDQLELVPMGEHRDHLRQLAVPGKNCCSSNIFHRF
jgi:hypothetical protein